MKSLFLMMTISTFLFSCTQGVEKPPITIGKYSNQAHQIHEVVNKLMSEPDVKTMHDMADGVEETRAIVCDQVGEECNAYYEFLNKVVNVTNDGELSKADRALLEEMRQKLNIQLKKSELKIQNDWKNYINAEKRN